MKFEHIITALQVDELVLDQTLHSDQVIITGSVQTDTKKVITGDVFICIPGLKFDGHDFADEVKNKGAVLLIVERFLDVAIAQIQVKDSRKAVAILAKLFYHDPSKKFDLIGVTGTNGKTSTTIMLSQLLQKSGFKVGLIGTLGYQIGDNFYPLDRTTPDVIELHEIFKLMIEAGCEKVVMEVSSHALALHRVYGLTFQIAIFTNLTADHLDFHRDFEDYGNAKLMLFKMTEKQNNLCIINIDDKFGKQIYDEIKSKKIAYTSQKSDIVTSFRFTDVILTPCGTKFTLNKKYRIESPYLGKYNIYNLVAAMVALSHCISSLKFHDQIQNLSFMQPISGRMQKIHDSSDIDIIVDYAHTPDALENILQTAREFTRKRLITVWGCGGDRDKFKRPIMGRISTSTADLTIITDDNPRTEKSADIIRDIVEPLDFTENYLIISDRATAIHTAIRIAQLGDVVMIVGKGHENYQEINNIKYNFSDTEQIEHALSNRKNPISNNQKLEVPIDILNIEKLLSDKLSDFITTEFKLPLYSISTDSRIVTDQSIFIALSGERYDGADFVNEVVSKNPHCICIVNQAAMANISQVENVIKVENTLLLYGQLAKKYLQLFGATVIAITGSTGKTTTKEILYNILSENFNTFKSAENENNFVGVPKNIFRMRAAYNYAIFEIGTNNRGEIDYLSNLLKPEYSLVISINPSHLDGLGSLNNIYIEKLALPQHTKKFSLIPYAEDIIHNYLRDIKIIVETIGFDENSDYKVSSRLIEDSGLEVTIRNGGDTMTFKTSYQIPFYAINICISAVLANRIGMSIEQIEAGLQRIPQINNRMDIERVVDRTIVWDCYNANPCSMEAAISYWKTIKPDDPHVAILGDMLELGENAADFHEVIAQKLHVYKIQSPEKHIKIIGVGPLAVHYQPNEHFDDVAALCNSKIIADLPEKSVILVKGSNAINLHRLKGEF
jgi:murE/murF fusion protein